MITDNRKKKLRPIVPHWYEFCQWAKARGYGESYFDLEHSRCRQLQEQYLQELEILKEDEVWLTPIDFANG